MNEPEVREIAEKWSVICEKGMQVREAILCACREAYKLGHDKRAEMAIQQALDERAAPTD